MKSAASDIDTSTPSGFKDARKALGLSIRDVAHIINSNEKTVRIWERSEGRGPNPVAARIMIWLLDGYRPPEWPVNGSTVF